MRGSEGARAGGCYFAERAQTVTCLSAHDSRGNFWQAGIRGATCSRPAVASQLAARALPTPAAVPTPCPRPPCMHARAQGANMIRLFKLLFFIVLVAHWITCLWWVARADNAPGGRTALPPMHMLITLLLTVPPALATCGHVCKPHYSQHACILTHN